MLKHNLKFSIRIKNMSNLFFWLCSILESKILKDLICQFLFLLIIDK